jgi:SAM-dependent methyltransferase
MSLVAALDRRFYPGVTGNWDDCAFRELILERLEPHHQMLDLGAGAGIVEAMNFRGRAGRVCGLDPDPRVSQNPYLDEAKVGLGEKVPWSEATFDVVIADNVLEHLERPREVFSEIRRVLRPGGVFLFKTPNRRHYVAQLSRLTPHAFHQLYNRLRNRASEDTFPTFYRANTPADVRAIASATGLEAVAFRHVESRPEYLRMLAATYLAGIAYERLVNSSDWLAGFRVSLMGELRRTAR